MEPVTVLGSDVLLGVLDPGSPQHAAARAAVGEARQRGHRLVVAASTYAELAIGAAQGGAPEGRHDLDRALAEIPAAVVPLDAAIAGIAADLCARHPDLPVRESLVVGTAEALGAERILTFDGAWGADVADGAAADAVSPTSQTPDDVAAILAQAQADAAEERNAALFEAPPGRRAAEAAAAFVRLLDAAERDIAAHGGTLWHVRVGRSGEGRGIRISQHLIDLIGQEDGTLRVRVRRYRSGRAYEFDEVSLPGIEPVYDLSGLDPAEVDELLEQIALGFVVIALGITTHGGPAPRVPPS